MIETMNQFNQAILAMKRPWPFWAGLLVAVNGAGSLLFIATPEAQIVLTAVLAGAVIQMVLFRLQGFTRLLGVGHVFWVPMIPWLMTRLDQVAPGDALGFWILLVIAIDGLSLVIDAVDVLRYAAGDRAPMIILSA